MKTRAGITLIEVLIAIFIMAIGMLALLTLFPVGALSMAQAIRDQRVSEAGQQATAVANMTNIRLDPTVTPLFATTPRGARFALTATWDGPSYPVFVDPWYVNQINPAPATPNTGTLANVVMRSNLSFVTTPALTMRWCGLQDELSFQTNGTLEPVATPNATGNFDREPRTTWGYWLRRSNYTNPNVVEMSIVVYSGRNLLLPPVETLLTNTSYNAANPTANPTAVTVASNTVADIRRGQWIVDLTFHNPDPRNANAASILLAKQWGPVHGYWYRIVEVVDANGSIVLEVQPQPPVGIQQFMVMDGVADVFNKGTGWK